MTGSRAFIAVAGLLFTLLVVIHVARVVYEGTGPLHDPFFVGATIVAFVAAIWAVVLLARRPR
jgi:hypothetical protein